MEVDSMLRVLLPQRCDRELQLLQNMGGRRIEHSRAEGLGLRNQGSKF